MKDITAILKSHGIEFEDEAKAKEFTKEFVANYKTVDEWQGLKNDLTTANNNLTQATKERDEFKATAEAFEGLDPKDVEGMKKAQEELTALKKQVEDRDKDDKEAEARKSFEAQFDTALGERKFANALIRSSVLAAVQEERKTDQASGLSELIDKVTKDQVGIFENPQGKEGIKLPKPGENDDDDGKDDDKKPSIPSFI